ncbi:MAG: transposase [Candidatus Nealsonbacteria bacterium]
MEFYHTYNRGTEKRKIFLEDSDYFRGVHDLYEFNDAKSVINLNQRFNGSSTAINNKLREKIVSLGTWCLMPNHYHIFSSPLADKGLPKFHQKFGGGYTWFFNAKYKRSGALFQGRYKKIQVINDTQALQLICYIHSNPLDLWKPDWKEKGLINLEIQNALKFLEQYRWSSHLDWWGIKNFPSLIEADFMNRFFNGPKEYREFFTNWLRFYGKNIDDIRKLILE